MKCPELARRIKPPNLIAIYEATGNKPTYYWFQADYELVPLRWYEMFWWRHFGQRIDKWRTRRAAKRAAKILGLPFRNK